MNRFKVKLLILFLFSIFPFTQRCSVPSEERTFGLLMYLIKGLDWHNPMWVCLTLTYVIFLILVVNFLVDSWFDNYEK